MGPLSRHRRVYAVPFGSFLISDHAVAPTGRAQFPSHVGHPTDRKRAKELAFIMAGPPPHYPSEDVDAGDLAKRRPLKAANGHGRRRANQTHLSPDQSPDAYGSSPWSSDRSAHAIRTI